MTYFDTEGPTIELLVLSFNKRVMRFALLVKRGTEYKLGERFDARINEWIMPLYVSYLRRPMRK